MLSAGAHILNPNGSMAAPASSEDEGFGVRWQPAENTKLNNISLYIYKLSEVLHNGDINACCTFLKLSLRGVIHWA